jgi:fucose permease
MNGQRHVNAAHPGSDRMARPLDAGAPHLGRRAAGAVLALILMAVGVFLLFETPQFAWLALLAAALVLLDVALALGIRQWLRDLTR